MTRTKTPERKRPRLRKVDLDARVRRSDATFATYRRRREIVAIGEAIRRMREEAGLSQSALAERVGTTQSHISDLERGSGRDGPSMTLYFRIMRACGRDTASLRLVEDSVKIEAPAAAPSVRAAEGGRSRPAPAPVRTVPTAAEIAAAALLSSLPWLPVTIGGLGDLLADLRSRMADDGVVQRLMERLQGSGTVPPGAFTGRGALALQDWAGRTGAASVEEALSRYEALTFRDVMTWGAMGAREAMHGVPWAQTHRIVDAMGLAGSWNSRVLRMDDDERRRARIALDIRSLSALTRVEVVASAAEAERRFLKSGRRTVFQIAA